MKHKLGDIWGFWDNPRRLVRVVGGEGKFAYWHDRSKYEVMAGELDLSRANIDFAGMLLGYFRETDKPRNCVIRLRFTVTMESKDD